MISSSDPALASRIARLRPFLHDLEAGIDGDALLSRFCEVVYSAGWVLPEFDWMSWGDEADRYAADPARLARADLRTISQLLTLHVRAERFVDGHLADQVRNGQLQAILRRLCELETELGGDPLPNIFDLIARTSSRTEPYHSRFLAAMLEASCMGDRRFFDGFWALAWPDAWRSPLTAVSVRAEYLLTSERIDIVILAGDTHVLAVEVKTQEASTTPRQLERYWEGLSAEFPERTIALVYLTPFNREHAGDAAEILHSVREFEAFAAQHPAARHLSWLDVAAIEWDGGELWRQHVDYVRDVISSERKLTSWKAGGTLRSLAAFFGEDAAERFWEALAAAGAAPREHVLDLAEVEDAATLANAFRVLIESVPTIAGRSHANEYPPERAAELVEGPYGAVHEALFGLAEEYDSVWVQGKRNYGLRVAHPEHPGGVSLVTSRGDGTLEIGRPR